MKNSEVMYIEAKDGVASLTAKIGRVRFSKTGKTLEYAGRQFQSLKGAGYKANFADVESGDRYWISRCRKDGNDGLYRTTVHVDAGVRDEYWTVIRSMPERSAQKSFVSTGKHKPNGQEPKDQRNNL